MAQEVDVRIPVGADNAGVQLVAKVASRGSPLAFVITHPYGPLGGNLQNNVVRALTTHLGSLGFSTCRFNFRGVSGSSGRATWRGWGEKEDLQAACSHMMNLQPPPKGLVILGYSYGSVIGSAVAGTTPEVLAYAAISYPSSVSWALTLFNGGRLLNEAKNGHKPKLLIMSTEDNFTSLGNFQRLAASFPSPKEVAIIKGMDHFYFGKEGLVCRIVQEWLQKVFATSDLKTLAQNKEGDVTCAPDLQDGQAEH